MPQALQHCQERQEATASSVGPVLLEQRENPPRRAPSAQHSEVITHKLPAEQGYFPESGQTSSGQEGLRSEVRGQSPRGVRAPVRCSCSWLLPPSLPPPPPHLRRTSSHIPTWQKASCDLYLTPGEHQGAELRGTRPACRQPRAGAQGGGDACAPAFLGQFPLRPAGTGPLRLAHHPAAVFAEQPCGFPATTTATACCSCWEAGMEMGALGTLLSRWWRCRGRL